MAGNGIDCSPMAYQRENQVWVLEEGRTTRLSEDGLAGANPSVSMDGSNIAFTSGEVSGDFDLYAIASDGSNRRLVWGSDMFQSAADWSPDGQRLVFDQYSEQDGVIVDPLQVYIIDAASTGDPIARTSGAPNGKPTWGSDDRILFISLRDAEEQEVYSMIPDGSDLRNLSRNPARDVLAELSPDGTTIVFASDRSGNGDFDIWAMDADGSNPTQLTDQVERDTNPTWSTDGRHIIYRSDRRPVGLWYMSPDGSGQSPLLTDGWLASCP